MAGIPTLAELLTLASKHGPTRFGVESAQLAQVIDEGISPSIEAAQDTADAAQTAADDAAADASEALEAATNGEWKTTNELEVTATLAPTYMLTVPAGVGHVIFTGAVDGEVGGISTPADPTKVHYLQITAAGDGSTYLYQEVLQPGFSDMGIVGLEIDVNASGAMNLVTDCEIKTGSSILLYWSPVTGVWAAVTPYLKTFIGF